MEERKKKGLCYSCAEKWGLGHKCKSAKLFLLEGIELVPNSQSGVKITKLEEEVGSPINEGQNTSTNSEEVEITLYALIGTPTPGTMRIKGKSMELVWQFCQARVAHTILLMQLWFLVCICWLTNLKLWKLRQLMVQW